MHPRVKQVTDTVDKVLSDPVLMRLHRQDKKTDNEHIRIRVGFSLNRDELTFVRTHLQRYKETYPRTSVENGTWSSKRFKEEQGVIIKLHLHEKKT